MTIHSNNRSHAIVLGASMAGLLTARVLSNHFERVTLVERDAVHPEPESRKGQPQTRHLHGLLAAGLDIMTRYYPDLPEALVAGGALVQDMAEMIQWYTYGGYRQRFTLGRQAAVMSRPFLESLIRQRTLARPNFVWIEIVHRWRAPVKPTPEWAAEDANFPKVGISGEAIPSTADAPDTRPPSS